MQKQTPNHKKVWLRIACLWLCSHSLSLTLSLAQLPKCRGSDFLHFHVKIFTIFKIYKNKFSKKNPSSILFIFFFLSCFSSLTPLLCTLETFFFFVPSFRSLCVIKKKLFYCDKTHTIYCSFTS